MCEADGVSFSYIVWTTSLYGPASLTNRAPAPLTNSPPGNVRSARQNQG